MALTPRQRTRQRIRTRLRGRGLTPQQIQAQLPGLVQQRFASGVGSNTGGGPDASPGVGPNTGSAVGLGASPRERPTGEFNFLFNDPAFNNFDTNRLERILRTTGRFGREPARDRNIDVDQQLLSGLLRTGGLNPTQQRFLERIIGAFDEGGGDDGGGGDGGGQPVEGQAPPRGARIESRTFNRILQRILERKGGADNLNAKQMSRIRQRAMQRAQSLAAQRAANLEGPGSQIDTGRDQAPLDRQEVFNRIFNRGFENALERRGGRDNLTPEQIERIRQRSMIRASRRFNAEGGPGSELGPRELVEGREDPGPQLDGGGEGGGRPVGTGGGGGGDAGGGLGEGNADISGPPGQDALARLLEELARGIGIPERIMNQSLAVTRSQLLPRERALIRRRSSDFAGRGLFGSGLQGRQIREIEDSVTDAIGQASSELALESARQAAQGRLTAVSGLLGQGDLGLRRELGLSDLALREALGMRGLDLEGERLGLSRELGLSDLALREALGMRGLDLEGERIGLSGDLGFANLGLQEQELAFNRALQEALLNLTIFGDFFGAG